MIRLTIEEFSCIEQATFELSNINVIIGPQASGKSIICKLLYFFNEMTSLQSEKILEDKSINIFIDEIKSRFAEWFPMSAWGGKKFTIKFEAGDYQIKITRTTYNDTLQNGLRVWTSQSVKSLYKQAADLVKSVRTKNAKKSNSAYAEIELEWRIKEEYSKIIQQELKDGYFTYQTFIPAGRSFFTSLGRAFMAFDQGSVLDPITRRFGRVYSSAHDHFRFLMRSNEIKNTGIFTGMLGGELKWVNDRPMLESTDGRVIPFSALSSGQQELLPLIIALSAVTARTLNKKDDERHLLYIEEPEAHLFPSAQNKLVEELCGLATQSHSARKLVLTTHSPYVLSKINNLIKAGSLQSKFSQSNNKKLIEIIPKKFHIESKSVSAYAIIDGNLVNIIDDDGLINAEYLDRVSGEIAEEFSKLLELEFCE